MIRSEKKEYRPDIDGLRAIAVLSVLFFHFFPTILPGGFVGVDVFFVISGFLITRIIWREHDAGTFSFIQFYIRRIRRIFPALILVLVACTVVGWWILFDDEFKQLGNHTMRASVFLSNFVLWREAGYFDEKAELKPLLHLWSLAIEEQFYIIWPGLIWLIRRKLRNPLYWLIGILLVSLFWNFYQSHNDPVHDFYSPLTRFWELIAGASLAVALDTRTVSLNIPQFQASGWVGVLLLLLSMLLCGSVTVYPGLWAVLPVFGALLLIASEGRVLALQNLMTSAIFIWLGEISYALYLWHWPIFSFMRIIEGKTPDIFMRIVGILLSLLLAAITVRYVERYFRTGPIRHRKIIFLLVGMIFIFAWGYTINRTQGYPGRELMDERYVVHPGEIGHDEFLQELHKFHPFQISSVNESSRHHKNPVYCYQSKNNRPADIVLLGDSHAEHLLIGLAQSLSDKNIVFCGFGGLPTTHHPDFSNVVQAVTGKSSSAIVLLAAQWETRLQELPKDQSPVSVLTETAKFISLSGAKVGFIDDIYRFEFDPQRCKYWRPLSGGSVCSSPRKIAEVQFNSYLPVLENVQQNLDAVALVKIRNVLCEHETCSMLANNSLAYRDSHHLSVNGSIYIGRYLGEYISNEFF